VRTAALQVLRLAELRVVQHAHISFHFLKVVFFICLEEIIFFCPFRFYTEIHSTRCHVVCTFRFDA
jgi:hypothetical protein